MTNFNLEDLKFDKFQSWRFENCQILSNFGKVHLRASRWANISACFWAPIFQITPLKLMFSVLKSCWNFGISLMKIRNIKRYNFQTLNQTSKPGENWPFKSFVNSWRCLRDDDKFQSRRFEIWNLKFDKFQSRRFEICQVLSKFGKVHLRVSRRSEFRHVLGLRSCLCTPLSMLRC